MNKVYVFETRKDADKALEAYRSNNAAIDDWINKGANINGLETVCLTNLSTAGKKYRYKQNYGNNEYLPAEDFKTLEKLAEDLKESSSKIARFYKEYGANVTQLIYKIREGIPVMSDEKKQELKEFLDTPEVAENINTLPFFNRLVYKCCVHKYKKDVLNNKDTENGFTDEEIAEFEMLYS